MNKEVVMNSAGGIDLKRYVAVGDSITAGYADAALYHEAQQFSFANLLSEQFSGIGGGRFIQPMLPPESVGVGFHGNSRIVIRSEGAQNKLEFLSVQGDLRVFTENIYRNYGGFGNMGVPGARVSSLLYPGYGNPLNGAGKFNPFFTRIFSSPDTSILSDVLKQQPTFFTLLIGSNDVLAYALSGGTGDSITSADEFKRSYLGILEQFKSHNVKGAVANLPDLFSIPFFTTIPYNSLVLSSRQAEELNLIYHNHPVVFAEGKNAYVIQDNESQQGIRQIKKGDLLLYDVLLDPERDEYLKGRKPVPAKYVLKQNDVELVRRSIVAYNEIIREAAKQYGLAFVNLHDFLIPASPDRFYNPDTLSLDFATTGIFSLDALHINTLGQALLANEFIKAINTTYKSSIPKLNIIRYRAGKRSMMRA